MEEVGEQLFKNYSKELVVLAEKDQKMRVNSQSPKLGVKFDSRIDVENTKRLKDIVGKIGWPTITKVGEEASYAAWIIAQHADHDVNFQKRCLDLMMETKEGDVLSTNIAYLTDRVAVNEGRKQIYGTQFFTDDKGGVIPYPIENPDLLEERRLSMGLEPFDIYSSKMRGEYRFPESYRNPKVGRFYKSL